jgi:hypothetical protein
MMAVDDKPAPETIAPGDAVVCRDLSYRFGDHVAVDHVNLEIRQGETFGLLGPNGAGKPVTGLRLHRPGSSSADFCADAFGVWRPGRSPELAGEASGRQRLVQVSQRSAVCRSPETAWPARPRSLPSSVAGAQPNPLDRSGHNIA